MKFWHLVSILALIVSAFFLGRYMIPTSYSLEEFNRYKYKVDQHYDSVKKIYIKQILTLKGLKLKETLYVKQKYKIDSVSKVNRDVFYNDPAIDSIIRSIHSRGKQRFPD